MNVYVCNPIKNKKCNNTWYKDCLMFGGHCYLTSKPEYAYTDEDGKPIEYHEDRKAETEKLLKAKFANAWKEGAKK